AVRNRSQRGALRTRAPAPMNPAPHEPCAHECCAHEPCTSQHTGSAQWARRSAPVITRPACDDAALSKERFNASAMPRAGLRGANIARCALATPTGTPSSGLAIEHGQQPRWDRCHKPKARQLSMSPFAYVKNRLLLALPRRELHRLADAL